MVLLLTLGLSRKRLEIHDRECQVFLYITEVFLGTSELQDILLASSQIRNDRTQSVCMNGYKS